MRTNSPVTFPVGKNLPEVWAIHVIINDQKKERDLFFSKKNHVSESKYKVGICAKTNKYNLFLFLLIKSIASVPPKKS